MVQALFPDSDLIGPDFFPWTGAAVDIDFAHQRYWWNGARRQQSDFTTFNLNGSLLTPRGLQALDTTIDISLALTGLGTLVPGSGVVLYENVSNVAAEYAVSIDDGTVSERIAWLKASSGVPQISVIDGGVTQANPGVSGSPQVAGRHTLAQSYDVNNFLLSADGIGGTADTSGTLPTVTTLRFGKQPSNITPFVSGWIRRLLLYTATKPQGALNILAAAFRLAP